MTKKRTTISSKTQQMALTAILAAIAFMMGLTIVGYPQLGFAIEITLMNIPVAIASVVLGWKAGLLMGAIFGITSFMSAAGVSMYYSAFGAFLLSQNAFFTLIVCIIPRLICGLAPGFIYKGLSTRDKKGFFAIPITCICTALINTTLFLVLAWLLFSSSLTTAFGANIIDKYGTINIFTFFIFGAGINAIIEVVVTGVLGTAISKPLLILRDKLS